MSAPAPDGTDSFDALLAELSGRQPMPAPKPPSDGYVLQVGDIVRRDADGNLHSDNEQAAVRSRGGAERWYEHGKLIKYREVSPDGLTWKTYDADGRLTSFDGEPAVRLANGTREWWTRDELQRRYQPTIYGGHRWTNGKGEYHSFNDEPSFVDTDGVRKWHRDGVLHRDGDKPAVVDDTSGVSRWFIDSELHREGDQPAHVDTTQGIRRWHRHGVLHRDGDKPAIEADDGNRRWFVNGNLHREGDQPAYIDTKQGTRKWYKRGSLHRDGGKPAVEQGEFRWEYYVHNVPHRDGDEAAIIDIHTGEREWFRRGKHHRDGGRVARIHADGTQEWFVNGVPHRDGGMPALITADGAVFFFVNGRLHRDGDEPAIVLANGTREWWVNGRRTRRDRAQPVIEQPGEKIWYTDDGANDTGEQRPDRRLVVDGEATASWYVWWHGRWRLNGVGGQHTAPAVMKADGSKEWWSVGKRHRFGGEPAVVLANGTREWWEQGTRVRSYTITPEGQTEWRDSENELHSFDDAPAVVTPGGDKRWYEHGELHRIGDKPAAEHTDGLREWWSEGDRHRPDDKPAVEHPDGSLEWWLDGVRHRDGGEPAVMRASGVSEFWWRGLRHRIDGPWRIDTFAEFRMSDAELAGWDERREFGATLFDDREPYPYRWDFVPTKDQLYAAREELERSGRGLFGVGTDRAVARAMMARGREWPAQYLYRDHGVLPLPPRVEWPMTPAMRHFIQALNRAQKTALVEWSTEFVSRYVYMHTRAAGADRLAQLTRWVDMHVNDSRTLSRQLVKLHDWSVDDAAPAGIEPGVLEDGEPVEFVAKDFLRQLWHRGAAREHTDHLPLELPIGAVLFEGRGVETSPGALASLDPTKSTAPDVDATTVAVGATWTRARCTSTSWDPTACRKFMGRFNADEDALTAIRTRARSQPILFAHRVAAPDVEAIDIQSRYIVDNRGLDGTWPSSLDADGDSVLEMVEHEITLAPRLMFHVVRDSVALLPGTVAIPVRLLETHVYPAGEECMLCANNRQPGKRAAAAATADEESKDDAISSSSSGVAKKQKVTKARMRFRD